MAQMNVNLAFSADTGKAKAQIAELQSLLSKIAYTGSTANATNTLQKDLQEASTAAKELQFHLNNAFNVSTGKFDLSMLDKSLKTSGSNITDLSTKLLGAGATGQQAFATLAQSISLADQPMLRVSKRMQEFAVTMKNTVKWQLSSSMLHGFMGAIQSAYGYAQDLNKSLTDIRIVTGYSTDQMAQFAEQANKAAKALSTTTTDYTNASLIYFQQGLSDAEVAARTDITVKMANAAGQSAEVVSEQLTAVWNNFADGSKSLEYYADVMTALGAATASSSDEISEGLSKFASVAESVGLSYEYATAALTTITSNTRESADVVGNALKTLFARLQGLKLGETLEDGVDLNKYSEALDKVGISIFEQNGELKAMDNILNEMAATWETLNNGQQVALAQTVAGVRQYTQLIALMENWDSGDSDSFMANLNTIENAEGALQKQADIYADSWEAAQKRVQAAAEGIYQSLLDDDFFISISNGFANLLGGLDAFIDGAGGVKTVLIGIAGIVSSVFANKIPEALDTFKYNLEVVTKGTEQSYKRIESQMQQATSDAFKMFNQSQGEQGINKNSSIGFLISSSNELAVARTKLAQISDRMSASEKQMAETELALIQAQQQEVFSLKQKNEELEKSIKLQTSNLLDPDMQFAFDIDEKARKRAEETLNVLTDPDQYNIFGDIFESQLENINNAAQDIALSINEKIVTALSDVNRAEDSLDLGNTFQPLVNILNQLDFSKFNSLDDSVSSAKTQIAAIIKIIPEGTREATGLNEALKDLDNINNWNDLNKFLKEFIDDLAECKVETKNFGKALKDNIKDPKVIQNIISQLKQYKKNAEEAKQGTDKLNQAIANFNPQHFIRIGEALGQLGGMLGNLVAGISSLGSALRTILDPNVSGWEKFIAVLTAASVALPMLGSAIKQATQLIEFLSKAENLSTIEKGLNAAATWLQAKATKVAGDASKKAANDISKETIAVEANTKAKIKNAAVDQLDGQMDFFDKMGDVVDVADDATDAFGRLRNAGSVLKNAFDKISPSIGNLGKSLLNIGKSLLKLVNWKAALAIAIIGGTAYAINYVQNADVRMAEQAAKAAEEAKTRQQEVKTVYDELMSNISNIDSGYAALENMTKGTDEWTQAVMELNSQIMELIGLYPELAGAINMIDGVLTIDKNSDEYKNYINKQIEQLNNANIDTYSKQIKSNEANYQVQENDVRKSIKYIDLIEVPTEYGQLTTQAIPRTITENEFNKLLSEVQQGLDLSNSEAIQEATGIDDANLISAIQQAASAIYQLIGTSASVSASNELLSNQIAQNALMTNENYQNSKYQDIINAAVGQAFEDKDNWEEKPEEKSSLDMAMEYAKIKGYELSQYYPTGSIYTYTDKDGETQRVTVGRDEINTTVNQSSWLDTEAVSIMNQIDTFMTNLSSDAARRVVEAAITGSTEGLTDEDYDLTKLDIDTSVLEQWFPNIQTAIQEILDLTLSNKQFDLEAWKSDYQSKMDAVGEIDENNVLDAKNYALLADEYSQYFDVQADGSAILKIKAEEFKAIVEGIELGKLKEEITNLQNESTAGTIAYGEVVGREVTEDFVTDIANDMMAAARGEEGAPSAQSYVGTKAEEGMIAATGLKPEDLDIYTTAEERIAAIAQAWLDLQNTLNENQDGLTDSANTIDELVSMATQGFAELEDIQEDIDATVLKEAVAEGLDPTSVLNMAEAYEDLIEVEEEAGETAEDAQKMAKRLALANQKTQKGIDNLAEGWEDWNKALKTGNKESKAYNDAIAGIEDTLSDMLGISMDDLSEGFAESAYEAGLLERIVKGDLTALDELRGMAAQDIIVKAELDYSGVEGGKAVIDAMIQGLISNPPVIGASLDSSEFASGLLDMLSQTDMTVAQMQALFDALGYEPVIDYIEIPAESASQSQLAQAVSVYDPLSGEWKEGTVESYGALGQGTMIRVPIISGSKTKYTGGGTGGGYTPPATSGGGGGGGGSEPKHAEKKNDSDKERYHTLNNQLEDLQSQYDQIADAKDRAFGKDKLKAIDDEIAKTQELIEKNEEYIAEAEKNVGIDKAVMEEYYNRSIGGPAIQYDENGNISNYDEIQDAMYAKYNQMAETYDEESNEWIQFEKDYEQFEKWLENYESSTDILRDKQAERQALINQQMDLELEKIQYQIELKMNVTEDSLALLEFQMEQLEDKAFSAAESIELFTDKANLLYEQMITDREGLDKVLGQQLSEAEIKMFYEGDMSVLEGKTFTEDQMQAIKDYRDNLLELNSELIEVQKQVEEQVMEAFEEYHEELDRGMEKFDHYNHMLESYQNIVDIVGKDVLGLDNEALADISEAQVENSINQLKASKDAYDSLQKQADDALQKQQEAEMKAALARAKGDEETAKSYEEDAEFWKETYTEMNEAAVEAQEEMMDNWGNTLEAIATQFELAIERAVEAFNDAIYEFGGLEGMSDDFSRQKEMDDMYLEDYQQIYELSKLTRDINNTIDDTENIAGKQKLKKLLEEINKLQEDGVEMSEYDLEYLQAEYNLRLAELELEEAQKAKDTVRLSRDNEGNWSYVYTQNTDAVDAAQQKYEDALYAMQDLSSNYIDEMSEQLIATSQEMQEALANVRVEDFASQEEYYAELARIEAQYQEQMAAQEAELNKAIANNKELYNTDWKNYSEATGYKISAAEEFATKFSDTLLGSLVGSEEATSNFTAIVGEATDSLVQGLANAAATYYTNLNTAMEAAGTSTSEFADLLAEDVEAIKTDSAEAADAVAQMAEKMDEEMTKITERVQKFQEDYGREIDKIIAKNLEMVETFNDMLEHLSIDPDQINVTYDISRAQDGEGGETVEVPEGTASGYTGMYTGDWGSNEGRVAVLHEKELLLNQDDTVNMLEALKVSKYMLEILNANTQMMSQGMGSLFPASVDNSVSEILEQQVSIVAEFPNAVNHSEIEEAFDTLINRAAQYANRK